MAVTRIKNNQITDASGANTQLGVNAAVKLQNFSVTASKLANSLTYGSDLTITGNLTVNGATTTVDTVNTLIKDPIITLADGQTAGTPTVDIGFIGLRGNQNSSFMGWNEGNTEFAVFLSNTTVSNTTANINSYGNFHANSVLVGGNLSVAGNVTGALNATSNVNAANFTTPGIATAASTVGGVITGTSTSVSGTTTAASVVGGVITGSSTSVSGTTTAASVVGGVMTGSSVSVTGNISAANFIGNISGNIDAAGANTQVQFNDTGDILGASAGFTFDKVGNVLTANGNINGANVSTAGTVTAASVVGGVITGSSTSVTGTTTAASVVGGVITGSSTSVTGTTTAASVVGGVITGSSTSVTGTTTAASVVGGVITGSSTSVTGTTTAASVVGGVMTGSSVSVTGNVDGAIVNTPSVVGATVTITTTGNGAISLSPAGTGNVSLNSRYINSLADPVQDQDAATKFYVDSVAQGLDPKASVVLATYAVLPAYVYNNGTSGVGATLTGNAVGNLTVDGVVVALNDRVLVKNEAAGNAPYNGIYLCTTAGAVGAAYILTRATDMNQPNEFYSAFTFVEDGTNQADTGWVCTNNSSSPVTIGTTAITFTQFSGAGSYTAGNALSLNGTVFNVNIDTSGANTVGINGSNQLFIPSGAVLTNPNITAATGTSLSVTANITGGNVLTGGLISATSNITGGNVLTGGLISATANITGGNLATGGAITGASTSVSGTTTAASVVGGVITGSSTSVTGTTTAASVVGGVITGSSTSVTGTTTAASVVGGVITGSSTSVTGTTTAASVVGGVITGSSTSVTGTTTAASVVGGVITGSSVSVTGDISGANTSVSGTTTAASVVGGVMTGTSVSVTGNVTGGNLLTSGAAGAISGSGNITGGNILTGGLISATGNGTFGNITVGVDSINSANTRITVNSGLTDTDIAFNGLSANVFYVDAGANSASFGASTQVTNAIVNFATTTSVKMPVGTTGQRPATGVTGMLRFNSTNNGIEIYNNTEWIAVGSTVFTVIADEQFNGDGSTVSFTLATSQTTNSCIVSINGVVQIPTTAYSVSTTTLTFTEAPAAGDLIDVRELTTTTTVNSLSNGTTDFTINSSGGNAAITVGGTANVLLVTPTDVVVTGNLTVSGNATLSGNILGDRIQNGTTIIDIQTVNGNANVSVSGTSNVAVFANTGVFVTGVVSASGNVTGNYLLGNGSLITGLSGTSITNGTSNVVVTANANVSIAVAGNNIITVTAAGIINNLGNGTGNIGNATGVFNTIFAKATSAQYADLAEMYVADAAYAPGVVVSFGGNKEVTKSTKDSDRAVAGVVSTNPSYIMNAGQAGDNVVAVALTGRVPTSVTGTVAKGDLMVSNGDGTARAEADPRAGAIIGKALEDSEGNAVIEVVVGRF
jgi:hypothetical protein